MTQNNIEFTYDLKDILDTDYELKLEKVFPDDKNQNINRLVYSNARLFNEGIEVGKIYYFSNNIKEISPMNNKYFDNVVIELFPNQYFEPGTFLTGQLFYGSSTNVFGKNKIFSFKALTTGGSFINKEIIATITSNETPIRNLKLTINN